jgi:hypothetical protein
MGLLGSSIPDDKVIRVEYLELIGVVLIQVGNGYSHYSVIVTGNISGLIYVDRIVVIVVGVFLWPILLVKDKCLVTLGKV